MSIRDLFGGRAREDRELADEMKFHIEEETQRNIRFGMDPETALLKARQSFGGEDRYTEAVRDERRTRILEDALYDVRFALRMLARAPVFTLVAVLSIALGLGANTAVFSVVRGVLLRPLPYAHADRIAKIYVSPNESPELQRNLSVADVFAFRKSTRVFEEIGAYTMAQGGVALSGMGDAVQVPASLATSGTFRVLGVRPLLGRLIDAKDDRPEAVSVALLSYTFWKQRFGGDPAVVGRTITVDGAPNKIIGVMPEGFRFPGGPRDEMWFSLQLGEPTFRAPFWLRAIGTRKPGVTAASVTAELDRMEQQVKAAYPTANRQWHFGSVDLKDATVADARATLLLLFCAVGLVLSIAAANLANLLLARASTRAPEMALRSSLGAGRARLVRQLLTESLVISGLGTILGLALAYWGVHVAVAARMGNLERIGEVHVDGVVLAFTLGLSILVGIVTGLVPAFRLSRTELASSIRHGGRAVAGGQRSMMRNGLVVVEFAFALMVLIVAGLLLTSLTRLQHVETGIGVDNMVAVRVSAPPVKYPQGDRRIAFFDRVAARFRQIPGVRSVAVSMALPPERLVMSNPFTPQGMTFTENETAPLAEEISVTPDYFQTLGIPIRSGRGFTRMDRDSTPAVAMVNETMAVKYFGGVEAAIGKWLQTGDPDPTLPKLTIVGVVPDVKYSGLDAQPTSTLYVPYAQNSWWSTMYVSMRTDGNAADLIRSAQAALREVDSDVPIMESFTLDQLRGNAVATPRLRAILLGAFALLALLLATAGIYGVMSYAVTQRRQEMGVRIALGADTSDIIHDVLGQGAKLAGLGIVVGLAGALAVTRMARTLLFGVTALDVSTYLVVTAILASVGLVACAVPALRAARTDPALAFRGE
jgi:predicted permease